MSSARSAIACCAYTSESCLEFDVFEHLKAAQQVYGKYGIFLQFASAKSIHMDRHSHGRLALIESDFVKDRPSDDQKELYERFAPADELFGITVFVVFELRPITWSLGRGGRVLGAANNPQHRAAVFLEATPHALTLAHEIGHVLMPLQKHSAGHSNLMNDSVKHPNFHTVRDPVFTAEEILIMRNSALLRVC